MVGNPTGYQGGQDELTLKPEARKVPDVAEVPEFTVLSAAPVALAENAGGPVVQEEEVVEPLWERGCCGRDTPAAVDSAGALADVEVDIRPVRIQVGTDLECGGEAADVREREDAHPDVRTRKRRWRRENGEKDGGSEKTGVEPRKKRVGEVVGKAPRVGTVPRRMRERPGRGQQSTKAKMDKRERFQSMVERRENENEAEDGTGQRRCPRSRGASSSTPGSRSRFKTNTESALTIVEPRLTAWRRGL
ncbi:hypothetical protein C8R44DRAFT_752773 [Mycena epipterygia]|nr:hypothetical protein C8R44DRAFT_752773 [Mycena epipterygia]